MLGDDTLVGGMLLLPHGHSALGLLLWLLVLVALVGFLWSIFKQ